MKTVLVLLSLYVLSNAKSANSSRNVFDSAEVSRKNLRGNRSNKGYMKEFQESTSTSDMEPSIEDAVKSLLGIMGADMIRSIYQKVSESDVSSEDKVKLVLADVISMVSDEFELDPSNMASVEILVRLVIEKTSNVDKDVVKGVVKHVGTAAVVAVGNADLDAENTERRRDIIKQSATQVAGAVAAATVDGTSQETDSSIEMLQLEGSASDMEKIV